MHHLPPHPSWNDLHVVWLLRRKRGEISGCQWILVNMVDGVTPSLSILNLLYGLSGCMRLGVGTLSFFRLCDFGVSNFFSAHLTCYMSKALMGCCKVWFCGAFAQLQKIAYLCQVCPFVKPHGKTQLLLDIFSLVLYFGGYQNPLTKLKLKVGQVVGSLRDLCPLMTSVACGITMIAFSQPSI